MNCTQVEKLLPLFTSHDLSDERVRSITVHLQTCARCAASAKEYRETSQLLKEFVPPEFSEDSFAEIRRDVWRQIETSSDAPTLGGLLAGWLQPRLVWAAAITLLITVSAVGIYFIANRGTTQPSVADKPTPVNRNTENEPTDKESPTPRLASKGASDIHPAPGSRPRQRTHQKVVTDQLNSLALNASGHAANSTPPLTANATESAAPFKNDTTKTLRLEIQTKNPNIRIIWFAPGDTKQLSPNSKGI